MVQMNVVLVASLIALIASVSVPVSAGFEEMARAGQWRQLLETAARRSEQLPLRPDEAFMAAAAARAVGERGLEERYLAQAGQSEAFAELARLELAELVVAEDPVRAVELALPTARRAPTHAMREAAVEVAVAAALGGVQGDTRSRLEQLAPTLPRSLRRRLELALAASDGEHERRRLGRLLAESTRDLEALEAARLLRGLPDLTAEERWWVAQALYRHALYSDAEPILESLDGVNERAVEGWQVAFLQGRCAFRQGRWSEAAERYAAASRWVRGVEQAADLEVHRARAFELAGRMHEAVAAAQRAVRLRTTDERRLFLARLRLGLDQPELALAGISRIRDRTVRARGELLVALHELRGGRIVEAGSHDELTARGGYYRELHARSLA